MSQESQRLHQGSVPLFEPDAQAVDLNPELAASQSSTGSPGETSSLWEFADIGFDTQKKLWFVQLFDSVNANVGFYTAKNIIMMGGCAIQYQWKDMQGRPFWHVRERFLASEVEGFHIDMRGNLVVNFKKNNGAETADAEDVPSMYSFLQYAYHLTSKETPAASDMAPMGFVEFCNENGTVLKRLNNKWIIVEDANRKTVGEFPKVRIRIDFKDITRIVVTRSAVVITGKTII